MELAPSLLAQTPLYRARMPSKSFSKPRNEHDSQSVGV